MKFKPLIAFGFCNTLVLSFAEQATANNKRLAEEIPYITNEAEYAAFVKSREGTGQASSIKSTRSLESRSSIRLSLSSVASSSRAKTPGN